MIKDFRDKAAATVFQGRRTSRLPPEIQPRAFDKLRLLDAATCLEDLKVPPGNRLEPLRGDRAGKWGICFRWHHGHAWDVEITDYH